LVTSATVRSGKCATLELDAASLCGFFCETSGCKHRSARNGGRTAQRHRTRFQVRPSRIQSQLHPIRHPEPIGACCPTTQAFPSYLGYERRAHHSPAYGEVARDLQAIPCWWVGKDLPSRESLVTRHRPNPTTSKDSGTVQFTRLPLRRRPPTASAGPAATSREPLPNATGQSG
jgi:hypothetical protein